MTYTGHTGAINSVAWSPNGLYLASASSDKTVKVWDARVFASKPLVIRQVLVTKPLVTYTTGSGIINSVTWNSDGTKLASASADKTVKVWDASIFASKPSVTSKLSMTKLPVTSKPPVTSKLSKLPVLPVISKPLVTTPLMTYSGHSAAVNSVAWKPKTTLLASASDDGTVQAWDSTTGKTVLPPCREPGGSLMSVAWSPNGKYLASASTNKLVQVWSTNTSSQSVVTAPFVTYTGHTDAVMSVAWSPEGKYLASASADKTVRVWQAPSLTGGKPATTLALVTYTGHTDRVTSVAWSPDGKYLGIDERR